MEVERMKTLIVGFGEIGQSLARVYQDKGHKVYYFDLQKKDVPGADLIKNGIKVDVLNIAIPYCSDFVNIVVQRIKKHKPKLTIVNSTVPIGTTQQIFLRTRVRIVHSPVTGKHPNLAKSILTFKKIVGGEYLAVKSAVAHYKKLGIVPIIFNSSDEAEASKLLCTTYYGWNILFMKYVHKFCEEHNLDFGNVYTKTNENYNSGYAKFGDVQYTRPNLAFMPGQIGGHCVVPNFKLLEEHFLLAQIGDKLNTMLVVQELEKPLAKTG
jgi:UDP-N-acetyl-D-mannosaminuronate dehydrogenase